MHFFSTLGRALIAYHITWQLLLSQQLDQLLVLPDRFQYFSLEACPIASLAGIKHTHDSRVLMGSHALV